MATKEEGSGRARKKPTNTSGTSEYEEILVPSASLLNVPLWSVLDLRGMEPGTRGTAREEGEQPDHPREDGSIRRDRARSIDTATSGIDLSLLLFVAVRISLLVDQRDNGTSKIRTWSPFVASQGTQSHLRRWEGDGSDIERISNGFHRGCGSRRMFGSE